MTHPSPETIRNAVGSAVTVFGAISKLYEIWQRKKGRKERETDDAEPLEAGRDDHSDRIIARLERENSRLDKARDYQERRANREYSRAEHYAGRVKALEALLRKRSTQEHDGKST